jgi:hypothetical protein
MVRSCCAPLTIYSIAYLTADLSRHFVSLVMPTWLVAGRKYHAAGAQWKGKNNSPCMTNDQIIERMAPDQVQMAKAQNSAKLRAHQALSTLLEIDP